MLPPESGIGPAHVCCSGVELKCGLCVGLGARGFEARAPDVQDFSLFGLGLWMWIAW